MLSSLLLTALTFAPVGAPSPAAPAPGPGTPPVAQEQQGATASEVATAIDVSLRWLRSQQDPATGGYGGVEQTAWALRAFLQSPRRYRVSDGPFLSNALSSLLTARRTDGAIADPDSEPSAVIEQTLAAARTLVLIDEDPAPAALAAALRFLRLESLGAGGDPQRRPSAAVASAEARRLLDMRAPDGRWEGVDGATVGTARTIVRLSQLHTALNADQAQPAQRTASPLPALTRADQAQVQAALGRGARFLTENTTEDGLWGAMGHTDPGITAMVVGALLTSPEPRTAEVTEAIARGLDSLASMQREDGSIHSGTLANYITSASVLAFARSEDPRFADAIARAREFLRELQADEGEGYAPDHRYYGGVGYGGDERPDLSNLQLALEALDAAGLDPEDDTYRKALRFLERTQNRSESNDLVLEVDGAPVRPGDDGGAAYAPGESKAGYVTLPDGTRVPRSYGSMTYALLRGYLFAGLGKDDPRVEAAWGWLTANYTLDVNPGFAASSDPTAPYQGLFYYFYSMAKALDTWGEESLVDAAGTSHLWRRELCGRLLAMQRGDGSWINENSPRWWEGNPVLATAYAMLTLDAASPTAGTGPGSDGPGSGD
jgi:squalene-hopene/tetraprenyl-beta-curcumene cyclase